MKTYNINQYFEMPDRVTYIGISTPIKNYDELEFAALQVICEEHKSQGEYFEQNGITVRRSGEEYNISNYGIMGYGLIIVNLDTLYLTNNTLYWFDSEEEKIQYIREQKLERITK